MISFDPAWIMPLVLAFWPFAYRSPGHLPYGCRRISTISLSLWSWPLSFLGGSALFPCQNFLPVAWPFPWLSWPAHLSALPFVFPCPSLALEIGPYTILGGELSVLVGGIDGIRPGQSGPGPGKVLYPEDGILGPVALMEGIEVQVLYEADAVDLELARPAKAVRTG